MDQNWKEVLQGIETGEAALKIFEKGYHCSEAIARALGVKYIPESDLNDTFYRVTGIYQGGVAGTKQSECGVLTAGMMVIAALYGRSSMDEDESRAVELSQKYWDMFKEEFETSNCTVLREGPAGPEAATRCGTIVVRGARMLADLLDAEGNGSNGRG